MDFDIDYLKSRYSLNSEEMRCLSRALGFPTSTLTNIFNPTPTRNISISEMIHIMERNEFEEVMNQRFNLYPSEWNKHVILTSIMLLGHRSVTFSNLNLIRCVFNFYEKEDGSGIITNKNHLLQCIKMCGRIISPLRLSHRLKHMHKRFYYPNRFQLWELLELILWSDVFEFMDKQNSIKFDIEKKNDLYELADDDIALIYTELRYFECENIKYIQEELTFKKGHFSKVLRIVQKPLNIILESNEAKKKKMHTRILSKRMNRSAHIVHVSYGSGLKYCAKTKETNDTDLKVNVSTEDIKDPDLERDVPIQGITLIAPKSKVRPKTAPIVTMEDIELNKMKLEVCKRNIEGLNSKYEEKLYLDLEYLRPGFWQRWDQRPQPNTVTYSQVNITSVRKPSQKSMVKLSRPKSGQCLLSHMRCLEYL